MGSKSSFLILKVVIASALWIMVRLTTSEHRFRHSDFQGSRGSDFLSGRLFETDAKGGTGELEVGRASTYYLQMKKGEEYEQVRIIDPIERRSKCVSSIKYSSRSTLGNNDEPVTLEIDLLQKLASLLSLQRTLGSRRRSFTTTNHEVGLYD